MLNIYQKENLEKSILGKQVIHTDLQYRKLHFCFLRKIDSHVLLWNGMTKQLYILTQEEELILSSKEISYCEDLDELIEKWCLVPTDFDEAALYDQAYIAANAIHSDDYINSYVVFTTTVCNARCPYCFENGCEQKTMSEKTACDVAQYMVTRAKGKNVTISWFGGEPLCNTKAIDIISDILRNNQIQYTSSIVTNGYLMSEKNINKAANRWNLKSAQITLDGTEEVYNGTKNYICSKEINPYQIVIHNIEALLNAGIRVNIRLNISDGNQQDLYLLIDQLADRFHGFGHLNVYCANLYDIDGADTSEIIQRKNERFYQMNHYLVQKGLIRHDLNKWSTDQRGCMAQNPHAIVITPDAKFGKCEHFSQGELLTGELYSDDRNNSAVEYWDYSTRLPECNTCELYPNCIGITHCPNMMHDCIEAYRPLRYYNLEQGMRAELNKYLRGKNNV